MIEANNCTVLLRICIVYWFWKENILTFVSAALVVSSILRILNLKKKKMNNIDDKNILSIYIGYIKTQKLSDERQHYWFGIENVKMYIKEIFVVFCVISNILAAEIPQPSIANLATNTEEFHKLFVPCSSSEKNSRNTNDNISEIEKLTHFTGNLVYY